MYLIYDLDGTLVTSSLQITTDMLSLLDELKTKGYKNILVTGGTYQKVKYQLCGRIDLFDMIFTECGAVLHQNNKQIYLKRIVDFISTEMISSIENKFINICSQIGFSHKGNIVDIRNGLIYLTPVGMEADEELRIDFIKYEEETQFREKRLIPELKHIDNNDYLEIVKGGKTGVSVYPKGVDKTQILNYIPNETIYFFGDSCQPNGNDHCLFVNPRCNGYEVTDYNHTIILLRTLFG